MRDEAPFSTGISGSPLHTPLPSLAHPRDYLLHVKRLLQIRGDDAVEFGGIVVGVLWLLDIEPALACSRNVLDDVSGYLNGMLVVERVVAGDARDATVDVGAAELLVGHLLAGRRLDERGAPDEDRALLLHDHGLVAHRRHVRAPGRARAQDDRDLGDPLR